MTETEIDALCTLALAFTALLALTQAAAAQAIVKQEPPSGSLRRGQMVFVDDGSCPAGQIKQVIAGGDTRKRTRHCVPRR
ncbi:MAG: DUF6719 family protein [Xanthobacteraceae bacterium]